MRIKLLNLILLLVLSPLYGEEYQMRSDVIKAKISYRNLNRICVKGDKIDKIFGVDNTFHFEKDDKTGEAFIRPTEDNGYAPISLSVVTVSGKTQDLLLEPEDKEASAIELVSLNIPQPFQTTDFGEIGNDYEECISTTMKKFITHTDYEGCIVKKVADRTCGCIKAKFDAAFIIDGFLCLRFSISSPKREWICLDEKMFSEKGDIALSLSHLRIRGKEKVTLFVLRK